MEFYELNHMYKLSNWLLMKEGISVRGNELYRQNKGILEKLYISLMPPMTPIVGNKDSLIISLKKYVFTDEQKNEMQQFKERKELLRNHELRRQRIEKLSSGPRPYEYKTQIAIDFFEEDDRKLKLNFV
jgi:hypothetical protein